MCHKDILSEFLIILMCIFRWVREFLSEENQGLDILVDYLSFTQVVMRYVHHLTCIIVIQIMT